MVLGCVFPDQYEDNDKRRGARDSIHTWIWRHEISESCPKDLGKTAYFHIKIDTGMETTWISGDRRERGSSSRQIEKLPHVKLEGMFTHFAKADEKDKTFSEKQYEKISVDERGRWSKAGVQISQISL